MAAAARGCGHALGHRCRGSATMKISRGGRKRMGSGWSTGLRRGFLLPFALILLSACQAAANPQPAAPSPDRATSVPASDRPLRIAITNEAPAVAGKFAGGASGTGEYADLFAAKLARFDYLGQPVAQLAADLPRLDNDTWRIGDDGSMETT